jgi:hypothetical protein
MAQRIAKKTASWAKKETNARLSAKYQVSLGSIGILNSEGDPDNRPHLFLEGKNELILIPDFEKFLKQVTETVHSYRMIQIRKPKKSETKGEN